MRRIWLACSVLLIVVVGGCLDRSPPPSGSSLSKTTSSSSSGVVIHGPGGMPPAQNYPGDPPQFVQRLVTDNLSPTEPTIAFTPDGVVFFPMLDFSNKDGQATIPHIFRSYDQGQSWTDLADRLQAGTSGGDPYIVVDAKTGRLYYTVLGGLTGGMRVFWSDDLGETWTKHQYDCGLCDHENVFSGPNKSLLVFGSSPTTIYSCFSDIFVVGVHCRFSSDDGAHWYETTPPYPQTPAAPLAVLTPEQAAPLGSCNPHTGWGMANPDTGVIYLPRGHCGDSWVARSEDSGLTWERILVDGETGTDTRQSGTGLPNHAARMAMDRAGNLYYGWLDGRSLPRISVSRDDGRTWAKSIDVSPPGLTGAKFIHLVAGEAGRIAVSYVGTEIQNGFASSTDEMKNAVWKVYVTFSLNTLDAVPVLATTTAHAAGDPVHRGPCEGRCLLSDDRGGMYDYRGMAIDPATGLVAVAYVDLCTDACAKAGGGSASQARALGMVGWQTSGTGLLVR